ncbi:MAG: hypothetical protein NT150_10270, partial [Bacteroidetes bacterium]|nr:hypothetical protein [Bacteroidota bacterium]
KGKLPKGFSFGAKAKIFMQDKGVLYVKNIASILVSDTLLVINTNDKTKAQQEIPEEIAALLLDDYAVEVAAETKVEPNQTKVIVRIQNQEVIPSKLTLMEGTVVKKELPIQNNMAGFGVMKDKKYDVIIKAENYKDFKYSFEPKSELKGGTIVIKALLLPLAKEVAKVKKTMPIDSSSVAVVNTKKVVAEVKTTAKELEPEKMVVDGVVQEAKTEVPTSILKTETPGDLG